MLKLPEKLPDARWETFREAEGDEPALRVRFAPITSTLVAAARRAVSLSFRIAPADVDAAGDAMSRALLTRGIVEWDGVGDHDGNPIEPTADTIERDEDGKEIGREPGTITLFLSNQDLFDWADRVYVVPWVNRDREKNGSSGSPAGTGVEATPENDTASSAAAPAPDAMSAPTSSKSRGRTKR